MVSYLLCAVHRCYVSVGQYFRLKTEVNLQAHALFTWDKRAFCVEFLPGRA